MKTVGIIGGIAPESTIQYYRLIIQSYREQKNDGRYPSILINSIDMKTMLDLIGANKLPEVIEYLVGEVKKLSVAGADFGLMASNTSHIVFDDIQQQSPIPLISIVEVTRLAAQTLGVKKVGLFGTRFTMQGHFYSEELAKYGIALVVPDLEEQAYIHEKYMSELVHGIYLPETRERLLSIVNEMQQQQGIDGLIPGGTELPFIMSMNDMHEQAIRFLDTTKIHVEQVVTIMLSD
jgi:aspartate racemase